MKPSDRHYQPVREAIRQALLEKGLNPKIVAERIGQQRHSLYNYLSGDKDSVDATVVAKWLEELHLPLDLLTKPAPAPKRKPVESLDHEDRKGKPGELRFAGVVESGAWRDAPKTGSVECRPFSHIPAEKQLAYVAGERIKDIADVHDQLVCIAGESHVVEGCYVVIRKTRYDLVQHAICDVHLCDADEWNLWPLEDRAPIPYRPGADNKVEIAAVLIGMVKAR